MKYGFLAQALSILLLALTSFACNDGATSSDSNTNGIFSPKIPGARSFADLGPLRKGLVSAFPKPPAIQKIAADYKALRGALYNGVADVQGLPRSQLEATMEVLVAPSSVHCGGASCSRVFGLTSDEISDFLDDSRDIVAKTPVNNHKDKIALRDLLIASLTKEDDLLTPGKPLSEVLAELPTTSLKPRQRPQASLSLPDPKTHLSDAEIEQIKAYSHTFSAQFRAIESAHMEMLLDLGYSPAAIKEIRDKVALINAALAKLPAVPGTTYRGLANVSNGVLSDLFRHKRTKRLITLGRRNLPALTSTSWNVRIAENFAISSDKTKHSIIYTIHQRSGKTIEKLSLFPREEEVLIPSDALFQVGKITYLNRERRILSVELIEIMKAK